MSWDNMEKLQDAPPRSSRMVFMRSKKGIAIFTGVTCLLVAAITVIALAATGVVHAGGSSDGAKSNEQLAAASSPASATVAITAESAVGVLEPTSASKSISVSTATSITTTFTSKTIEAKPTTSTSDDSTSSSTPTNGKSATSPSDVPLRIMALGASIVKGETSPGYLGFRKPLRDQLVGLGYKVNMVGSVRLGDFIDNDVEAYGGKKIKEMHSYAEKAVPKTLPNVFLINLGTNNLLQNKDVDKVGAQMEDMIDYLLKASDKSTVILSTMLTNKVGNLEATVLDMNAQYRSIMKKFEADGKPVVLAEMHPSEGAAGVPSVNEIGPDGSHPTVRGYEMMGSVFVKAIQEAQEKGFLKTPAKNGIPDDGEAERAGSSGS
ncbi:carbohydrate esterase family 3 protein [Daldinia caldariorum]|uniref:carbohydrate esterase family 3 protein n=1 Tax=Daldinia caldariorum TaxID=326644 RepID=UPI0020087BE3|nr:carbohydrate esterase family 3 protein [Daldinia caldariorum]KAI1467902.1 carbohydrate esterase family 3 protein [Daldinia caldariorum]